MKTRANQSKSTREIREKKTNTAELQVVRAVCRSEGMRGLTQQTADFPQIPTAARVFSTPWIRFW
jgi:hypothetical protein